VGGTALPLSAFHRISPYYQGKFQCTAGPNLHTPIFNDFKT
jgi:hypothetical protein